VVNLEQNVRFKETALFVCANEDTKDIQLADKGANLIALATKTVHGLKLVLTSSVLILVFVSKVTCEFVENSRTHLTYHKKLNVFIYLIAACGINSECRPENHRPVCYCPYGFEGDPYVRCSPRKYLRVNKAKHNLQE